MVSLQYPQLLASLRIACLGHLKLDLHASFSVVGPAAEADTPARQKVELPKNFDPAASEERIYKWWASSCRPPFLQPALQQLCSMRACLCIIPSQVRGTGCVAKRHSLWLPYSPTYNNAPEGLHARSVRHCTAARLPLTTCASPPQHLHSSPPVCTITRCKPDPAPSLITPCTISDHTLHHL